MKAKLKLVGRGVLAAVTSPEAVKAEKSIGALVLARVALSLGASAGIADLILRLGH